ncbi:hypothetical protein OUZ56_033589 [Daphnia magna]|uniref:Uncharacterized protein n=1 Tax=Daphnia magna TaxID=35525 RepID=A0ABR0BAW4_9CRUS|nr:hypothetical protein OUZ56_033589 [Daphnia magna]
MGKIVAFEQFAQLKGARYIASVALHSANLTIRQLKSASHLRSEARGAIIQSSIGQEGKSQTDYILLPQRKEIIYGTCSTD